MLKLYVNVMKKELYVIKLCIYKINLDQIVSFRKILYHSVETKKNIMQEPEIATRA